MKKRSVSLFLATIMLLSVVGVVSVSAQTSATTSLDPNAENGYKYTASTSGIYRITYLNGASNTWPPNSGPGNTWRNAIIIYLNRPISGVMEGAWDYQLGAISGLYSTPAQAEAAAQGTYVDIPMKAGDYIILLLPDEPGCYGDNQGGITVSIELSAQPSCTLLDAKMISPTELGLGVSVKYPASMPKDAPRSIIFQATINGKQVTKTVDVKPYTTPGVEWGKIHGQQNQMYDINGNLLPTTPLRINLEAEGIPRFTDNAKFTVTAVASYEGGSSSDRSPKDVTVLLPVVVIEGYCTVGRTCRSITPTLTKWLTRAFLTNSRSRVTLIAKGMGPANC